MRAGLPKREPEWLARWEEMGLYHRLREQEGRPTYILHDGPPYANGHLHIGHALNKILKDFVVRSAQMRGHDSRYVPGWDCHGLPIEWKIEEAYRKKGKSKDDVPVLELRAECRKFAEEWIDIQRSEFKRLGVTGNWDAPYRTMDFHAEAVIAEEFMKFLMNGSLYQGSKPVMWSVVEKTALGRSGGRVPRAPIAHDLGAVSGDGVHWARGQGHLHEEAHQHRDLDDHALDDPAEPCRVLYPEVSYGLYEVVGRPVECWATIGERLIMADSLAEASLRQGRLHNDEGEMWRRLCDVTADDLSAMVCAHPLGEADPEWGFDVPMLPGDHVTEEAGTGFVHTAPSHGADDYEIGQRHGLPMTYNVLENGSFRADLPFFGGAVIFTEKGKEGDANKRVIDKLVETGALLARGRVKHSYPHSWRSKAPLIFRNTQQWFVAIDHPLGGDDTYGKTIRERALRSIDGLVAFTPRSGRNRLYAMIENRPDWVLSRQRAWGVPLTCFVRKGAKPTDPDFLLRDPAVNARVVAAFEVEGADAWYEDGAKARFLGNDHDPDAFEQVFDILDVWFDSGSTHAFVLRDREDGAPDGIADVYLEGHRPASRLVPFLDASGLWHQGARALQERRDPRLHAQREGREDGEIRGQRHGARGTRQAVWCGHPAPLGGSDRLHCRSAHRAGNPERRHRQLQAAAQQLPLPARCARRVHGGRAGGTGRHAGA